MRAKRMQFPMDVKAEMQVREETLKVEHQDYLQGRPEVELLLQDFISAALVEQPVDVFDFARSFFSSGLTASAQDAEFETGDGGDLALERTSQEGQDANSAADDLGDLDAMIENTNPELMTFLKSLFESIDTDGSGTLSRGELKAKLEADDELPNLLGLAGGESWSIVTQLDADGDGEITWLEFERMITGGLA